LITGISQNCSLLTSKNIYGDQKRWNKDDPLCFEYSIESIKEMTVHTQTNIIGFTFILFNGQNKSYIENTNYITSKIDLANRGIIGYNIYIGEGVDGLKFQLSDSSSTELFGDLTNKCFSYLNSSFFKIQYLEINTISGCVEKNNLTFFPYLAFSFDFSNCQLRSTLTQSSTTHSTMSTTESSSRISNLTTTQIATNLLSTVLTKTTTRDAITYNKQVLTNRLLNGIANYLHETVSRFNLILALNSGNEGDAIFRIQNGADVNIEDNYGNTALILGTLIQIFKFTFLNIVHL
jgi:hypothetical protein